MATQGEAVNDVEDGCAGGFVHLQEEEVVNFLGGLCSVWSVLCDCWTRARLLQPLLAGLEGGSVEGSLLVGAVLVISTADVSPHSSLFRFSVRGLGLHAAWVVLCPQGVSLGGQEDQHGRHQQDQQLFRATPVNRRRTTLHDSDNNMV